MHRKIQRGLYYEEFLHKKVNNKDVYVNYGATEDIEEDARSLRQDGDVTVFNWSSWLKFLKIKHFLVYFVFSLVLAGM